MQIAEQIFNNDLTDDYIEDDQRIGKPSTHLRDLLNAGVSYGIRWGRR